MDKDSKDQAQGAEKPPSELIKCRKVQCRFNQRRTSWLAAEIPNPCITFSVYCHVESTSGPDLTTWELPPYRSPFTITLPAHQYIGHIQTFVREHLVDVMRRAGRGFEYDDSDAILVARAVHRVSGQAGRGYHPDLFIMGAEFFGDVRAFREAIGGPNLWIILYRGPKDSHLKRMARIRGWSA